MLSRITRKQPYDNFYFGHVNRGSESTIIGNLTDMFPQWSYTSNTQTSDGIICITQRTHDGVWIRQISVRAGDVVIADAWGNISGQSIHGLTEYYDLLGRVE